MIEGVRVRVGEGRSYGRNVKGFRDMNNRVCKEWTMDLRLILIKFPLF